MKQVVWTIAGSDSGCGAGIQADLATFRDLDVFGASIITAVTAQNTTQVISINPVPEQVLLEQWHALATDMLPRVIKIGLLASREQVSLVARLVTQLRHKHEFTLVYDPVAVASSGSNLVVEETTQTIKEDLLPLVDVLTPNADELFALTGVFPLDKSAVVQSCEMLKAEGCKAIIAKGGHWQFTENAEDYCCEGEFWLSSPRLDSVTTHGTGCTLASALAAELARDSTLADAFVVAKAYLNQGIDKGDVPGKGLGCVGHSGRPASEYFPSLITAPLVKGFAPCDSVLGLYPVVDSFEWIEKLISWGVKTCQLRIKENIEGRIDEVKRAISLAKQHKVQLFINDHWQLAIELGAYGVHLGQEDIDAADLDAIAHAGLRLGISTHGYYELLRGLSINPSYIAIGAIFPTQTKDMTGQIQGVTRMSRLLPLCKDYPVVVIGGISESRVAEVQAFGATNIALVTAITQADDPEAATRRLLNQVEGKHGRKSTTAI